MTVASQATSLRVATAGDLDAWDDVAVRAPGGHVLQSQAWASFREGLGRRAWRGVYGDGGRVLAMIRPWPAIGGGSAYAARGPIPGLDTAARLSSLATALGRDGVDVLAADPEVPEADAAYRERLLASGFHAIDELQPSRHRMAVLLGATVDETAAFGGLSKATRQRVRAAERAGLVVVRHDRNAGAEKPGEGFAAPGEPISVALTRFEGLLRGTADRRGFVVGPHDLTWWRRAFDDGWLVHLEARDGSAAGDPVAALALFRHGGRISTAHSADQPDSRRAHPGALHLLRWRALQLAVRSAATEFDLGGVDVTGARHEPQSGDPMYGLYEHKRSFGAVWIAQAGAHERVERPWRYAIGRAVARATRVAG